MSGPQQIICAAVRAAAVSDSKSMLTVAFFDHRDATWRLVCCTCKLIGTVDTEVMLDRCRSKHMYNMIRCQYTRTLTIHLSAGWGVQHSRTSLAALRVCCHQLGHLRLAHNRSHSHRLAHPSKPSKAFSVLQHPTEL